MKTLILIIVALVIGLIFLSCRFLSKSQANRESSQAQTTQNANQVTNWDDYKNLLFVDQSLEELVNHYSAPKDLFSQAYKYVKDGKSEDAKKSLKQVLADPTAEVRAKLWAWRALRQLGEKPPSNIANEVQGMVLEVPVDNWIDTLAAYSDGRARYLNGKGGAIVWENPEEPRISSLVRSVIDAAKPLVEKSLVYDKHQPTKNDVVRVSILTYGGIHIIEAKQSDITENHIMSPVYNAGTQLFLALLEEDKRQKH
jgi:uncharacterized protein YxeA